MFTVGASDTCAHFDFTSSASAEPISLASSGSHVAPMAIPTGNAAALTPPTSPPPPRAPFGPSVTRSVPISSLSIGLTDQKSCPERRDACSSRERSEARDSTSLSSDCVSMSRSLLF
jgi:hypothetical protein